MKKLILLLFFSTLLYAQETDDPKTIHVYVALCDNINQGIVPVPKSLGNGQDPKSNLYWGALYGVKTHFKRSADWSLVKTLESPNSKIWSGCYSNTIQQIRIYLPMLMMVSS